MQEGKEIPRGSFLKIALDKESVFGYNKIQKKSGRKNKMKKILRVVAAVLLLCTILSLCSACTKFEELKKKKARDGKKIEFRESYFE